MPPQRAILRNWPAWLPLTLLAITILALFYRLVAGEVIFWGLPALQFYPWRDFANSELAAGRIPLWNPYNGAGAPLLANYQSAILYPPHLLYLLLPGPQTMGLLGMLHLFWAGVGMWRLTRRLDCGFLGRGIATLAYPLSTTLVARFGTIPMVDAAAWLPWLILHVDILLDGVTLPRVLSLAVIVAMQLLAGHAQWTYYSFLLAGAYVLWRLIAERRDNPHRRWQWIIIGGVAAVLLGVGLAAAQLVPTAELQAQSQRVGGLDETFVLNFSFAPLSLITLFNPNFFGNPGDGSYVIGGAYFETAIYVGILPLALALIGIVHYARLRWRKRRKLIAAEPQGANHGLIPFFAIVTLVAIILAFGKYAIYPLLYRYVPTFSSLQAPSRWLLLAAFSIPMLAALAVPMWRPDRRARRNVRIALIGAVSLIAAGIAAQLLVRSATPITAQLIAGITVLGVLLLAAALIFLAQPTDESRQSRWLISVLIFVAADLWWANAQSNPTVPASFYDRQNAASPTRLFYSDPTGDQLPQSVYARFLTLNDYRVAAKNAQAFRESNFPNLNLLDRQPVLNNFDPLRITGFERLTKLLNESQNPALLQAGASIGSDNEHYPTLISPTNAESISLPRVWMVSTATSVQSLEEAEKIMRDPDWSPQQTVIVQGKIESNNSGDPGSAHITQEDPQNLTISVDSSQGGWLVVADTYYPGWLATLDGTEVPIYRANLAFRGVQIAPGTHTVRMLYRPNSWNLGLVISAASLAILVLAGGYALLRTVTRRETEIAINSDTEST